MKKNLKSQKPPTFICKVKAFWSEKKKNCWTSRKQILKKSTIYIFQHFSSVENKIFEQGNNDFFSSYLQLKDTL